MHAAPPAALDRIARENARVSAAQAALGLVGDQLGAHPDPCRPGATLADYVRHLFRFGGIASRLRAAGIVERFVSAGV
jgi:hypothetical protein